jgi:hypothetical protein
MAVLRQSHLLFSGQSSFLHIYPPRPSTTWREKSSTSGMLRPRFTTFPRVLVLLGSFVFFVNIAPAGQFVDASSAKPASDYPSGSPIPSGPDAPSGKDLYVTYEAWANRVIVQEFRRSNPNDTNISTFLIDAARYFWRTNEQIRVSLSIRAEELERTGSTDPAFQLLAGIVQKEPKKKEALLKLATIGFPKTRYSRFLLFTAATALGRSLQERKADAREISDADRIALEALRDGLNAESFHADEIQALRLRLTSESTESLLRRHGSEVADLFRRATGIPDWIKEFGQGRGYLRAAWMARTESWADKVPESGWEGWRENLAKAREHFTKAWELNPRDPGAAGYMIEVATGDGSDKPEMRRWFDRSVAAQMDFWHAYRSLMWALRPRWHGSHEEMLQFAEECLRTARFDTCVPYYYLMTVDDISEEERDHQAIYKRPEINRNYRQVLDRYLETPDSPLSLTYAHTTAAMLDYHGGNLPGARTHMAAIQFQPNFEVGAGILEDIPQMMNAVLGR